MHRLSCLCALLALLLSVSAHALDDAPLAVSAAQYLQLIRDSRDAAGQTAAALAQQAEQQALQKNWTAAIASQETAIAAGADPVAAWLNLSQLWQARAEQKQDDEARNRARRLRPGVASVHRVVDGAGPARHSAAPPSPGPGCARPTAGRLRPGPRHGCG